jgi:hypothetical protein
MQIAKYFGDWSLQRRTEIFTECSSRNGRLVRIDDLRVQRAYSSSGELGHVQSAIWSEVLLGHFWTNPVTAGAT